MWYGTLRCGVVWCVSLSACPCACRSRYCLPSVHCKEIWSHHTRQHETLPAALTISPPSYCIYIILVYLVDWSTQHNALLDSIHLHCVWPACIAARHSHACLCPVTYPTPFSTLHSHPFYSWGWHCSALCCRAVCCTHKRLCLYKSVHNCKNSSSCESSDSFICFAFYTHFFHAKSVRLKILILNILTLSVKMS